MPAARPGGAAPPDRPAGEAATRGSRGRAKPAARVAAVAPAVRRNRARQRTTTPEAIAAAQRASDGNSPPAGAVVSRSPAAAAATGAAGGAAGPQLNFELYNPASLRSAVQDFKPARPASKSKVRVRIYLQYMVLATINEGYGWQNGTAEAVAFLKALGFQGMKVGDANGEAQFVFYAIMRSPAEKLTGLMDVEYVGTVSDVAREFQGPDAGDVQVGKVLPPTPDRPRAKQPTNYNDRRWTALSKTIDLIILDAADKMTLFDFVDEFKIGRLLVFYQAFAVQVKAIKAMDDLSFLEAMQAAEQDLVPVHEYATVAEYIATRWDRDSLFQEAI